MTVYGISSFAVLSAFRFFNKLRGNDFYGIKKFTRSPKCVSTTPSFRTEPEIPFQAQLMRRHIEQCGAVFLEYHRHQRMLHRFSALRIYIKHLLRVGDVCISHYISDNICKT